MAQVGRQSIGNVDAPMGNADQGLAQFHPGPGPVEALDKIFGVGGIEARKFALQGEKSQGAVADGAGNIDGVPGAGAGAEQCLPLGHPAESGKGQAHRARRRHRIAANQGNAVGFLLSAKSGGKPVQPDIVHVFRQGQGKGVIGRPCAHGRQVRKVYRQQPDGDIFGGCILRKVYTPDQGIHGNHQAVVLHGFQYGGVIGERQGARFAFGQGGETAGDGLELTGSWRPGHSGSNSLASTSCALRVRARRSRIPLTMAASASSKKA